MAPADEQGHTPIAPPGMPSQFPGEIPEGREGESVQVAYLHSSRVSHSWHFSVMQMVAYDKSLGSNSINTMPYAVHCSGPNSLVEGRNMAAAHFLDNTEADWLFFIDTDMGFKPDDLDRLLFAADPAERPVVGGLCFAMKQMSSDGKGGYNVRPMPTLFSWGRTPNQGIGFVNRFRYPPETLVQVAGTGAAFLLIHRSVLQELRADGDTWFNLRAYDNGETISEDLSFCYRVASIGKRIFVHTGVKVTHHKEVWLDEGGYVMPDEEPLGKLMLGRGQVNTRPHSTCIDASEFGHPPESKFLCGPDCPPRLGHDGSDRWTGGDRKDEP